MMAMQESFVLSIVAISPRVRLTDQHMKKIGQYSESLEPRISAYHDFKNGFEDDNHGGSSAYGSLRLSEVEAIVNHNS